jgi:enterochelin esterase family protein
MGITKVQQGKVICLEHESEVLKSNPLKDSFLRDLYVYLPPSYDESDESFPTVYVLAGFTGRGRSLLNDSAFVPNFAERMDRLISSGRIKPMIAVLPDCFTRYGGSQYINSTATGRYEDYLIQEIVPFIDSNFRTIKTARAIMGKSSGGYGSLVLAMKYPEVFNLTCSISGDCYFEFCYLPDFPKAFRAIDGNPDKLVQKFWNEEERKNKHDFDGLNIIAMSACYSPNGADFDLPFDLITGEIRPEIWEKWISHDPVRLVEKYWQNLKKLKLLFIDVGLRDEFNLDIGARILSKKLNKLGVPHVYEEFDDGHFNISYRYNRSLELISKNILEQ